MLLKWDSLLDATTRCSESMATAYRQYTLFSRTRFTVNQLELFHWRPLKKRRGPIIAERDLPGSPEQLKTS